MAVLFPFCLTVLCILSLSIMLSLRSPSPSPQYQGAKTVQKYLSNHNILSILVERRRNRTAPRHSRQHMLDRKSQKFNKMIKQMKKEKEVMDNKYFRRNKRIQELFSKRLVNIKEYCARYKKGQKRGIRGIKPHAATKTFSLGKIVHHGM